MNIYVTATHRRPLLIGTTDTDIPAARALGLDVDLLIHPGGSKEWAICLGRHDDPAILTDWTPVCADRPRQTSTEGRSASATARPH